MFLYYVKILLRKYNCIYIIKLEFEEKNSEYYIWFINDDIVFIYYIGIIKLWYDWVNYVFVDYFCNIYNILLWRNIFYKKVVKKYEYKEKYKYLFY